MARVALDNTPEINNVGSGSGVLNRNIATTAGVITAGGLGVTSVVITASAIPAQIACITAATAGMLYLGDYQYKQQLKGRKSEVDAKIEAHNKAKVEARTAAEDALFNADVDAATKLNMTYDEYVQFKAQQLERDAVAAD